MAARGQLQIILWAQKLFRKLFKFSYHIPHDIDIWKWFFKVLLKFKIAAMDKLHIFLWAQKLKNWNQ